MQAAARHHSSHPEELAGTPAHARPRGKAERDAQKHLKRRRIRYILWLKREDLYRPGTTDRELAEAWQSSASTYDSTLKLVHQYSATCNDILAEEFDQAEVARRISLRMDRVQKEAMKEGRYQAVIQAAEVELRIAKVGVGEGSVEHHTTNHVQVIQVGAAPTHLVTTPAMKALVRGREAPGAFAGKRPTTPNGVEQAPE